MSATFPSESAAARHEIAALRERVRDLEAALTHIADHPLGAASPFSTVSRMRGIAMQAVSRRNLPAEEQKP